METRDQSLRDILKSLKAREQLLYLKVEDSDQVIQRAVHEEIDTLQHSLYSQLQEEFNRSLNEKLSETQKLARAMRDYIHRVQFIKRLRSHLIVLSFCLGAVATSLGLIYYIPA